MMRSILLDVRLPFETADDRRNSEDILLWFLGVVSRLNLYYLKQNPSTAKLYESGVRYALPDQMEACRVDPSKLKDLAKFLRSIGASDETVLTVLRFVNGQEVFRDIPTLYRRKSGDCFPLSQKIIARSKSTGHYELLAIGDLRFTYSSYEALSYNFSKCCYEFRDIVGFVDKGVKPVSKARLSNGTDLIATDDHKFWNLTGKRNNLSLAPTTMGEYVEAYVEHKAGRLSASARGERSRILQASCIPALGAVKPSRAEAYLAGIYAAEGESSDGSHTRIGQHKPQVREKIEAVLRDIGVDFSYQPGRGKTPGSGAQYSLLGGAKNPVIAALRAQGNNSYDMRLPQSYLSSDKSTVECLLEAHGDGDAWRPANGKFKRPGVEAIYATSSDGLMEQLRLAELIAGRPFYSYRYENHGGEGSGAIWRLHEYNDQAPKLHAREELLKDDLPGLRYGTVRNAMPFGTAHVGCIEVEGNHNFVLADGTLVSNCDNLCASRVAELWAAGIAASPYLTSRPNDEGGTTYHALVLHPDGSTEDSSLILGMGGEARAEEREEEKRKNLERLDNLLKAAKRLMDYGHSPTVLGDMVDSYGFVPRGGWPC